MLFENRTQVDAEYLMKKYATIEDYNKILKKPSFEASKNRQKIDKVNGGRVKTNKGVMMRASFMATDPKTKLKAEIRYAVSSNPKLVGDRIIDQFEPRYVKAEGANFSFQNDIHLAVYMFLNANNSLSPLRGNSKAKPKFEYVDTKKRAMAKTEKIDALGKAMEHSRNVKEADLVILAKGLGIKGVDKKEAFEVRADIMEFAMNKPTIYNEKINTQLTYIEGRIWNLIDKGIVKLTNVGSVRRWAWVKGERAGEHILDISNTTQDARQALKNYFFTDINSHMNLLNNITNDITAEEKAKRDLEIIEEQQNAENIVVGAAHVEERVIGDALPAHLREPSQEFKDAANGPKYTEKDAIAALTDEFGNPPHHMKVKAWLSKNNGE